MFLGLSQEQVDEIIQIKKDYINSEEHDIELDRLQEALNATPDTGGTKNGKAVDEEFE
jgi:cytoskeletal protein RodZ